MTEKLQFPAPEPGDPEDVAWTLQTAGTMWGRGDTHEAIRWLRRAAEAASDGGADMRAVALARAAADLTNALDIPPSIPPPAPPAQQAPSAHSPPPPPARSAPSAAPSPPPPPVRSAPSAAPPPPSAAASSAPSAAPPPAPSASAPSHSAPPAARTSTRPSTGIRQRQALRVSVRPVDSGGTELIVRPLMEDEAPAEGEHEAMLVAFEAGAHLMSKKR